MADISELRYLAGRLGLTNIANGTVNLQNESLSNMDYLKSVLEAELAAVENASLQKRRTAGQLPRRTFSVDRLNKGVAWQIEQLEKLD